MVLLRGTYLHLDVFGLFLKPCFAARSSVVKWFWAGRVDTGAGFVKNEDSEVASVSICFGAGRPNAGAGFVETLSGRNLPQVLVVFE